jgi:outer membrane protein
MRLIRFLYNKHPAAKKRPVAIYFAVAWLSIANNAMVYAAESMWYKAGDPLNTQIDTLPKVPTAYTLQDAPCATADLNQPISLTEVANTSLCNNPQTQELWASTRAQAAQLGIAKSAYLPSVNNTTSTNGNIVIPESASRSNPYFNLNNSLVASYLLYDFGNRNATLENARQLLLAASASQNSTIQTVLLTATTA